ncbi:glycosyltransferase [Mesorhizobium australicum]|uniref:glycosyltransferase n=1 Tax=Mesorhizobium australicum TaxID=536018 RepID=UPI0033378352
MAGAKDHQSGRMLNSLFGEGLGTKSVARLIDENLPPLPKGAKKEEPLRTAQVDALSIAEQKAFEVQMDLASQKEARARERILELEANIHALTIELSRGDISLRVNQIEKELESYKQAKKNVDVLNLDLVAQIKTINNELETLRSSPIVSLGEEVLAIKGDWKRVFSFPAKFRVAEEQAMKDKAALPVELGLDLATAEALQHADRALAIAEHDGWHSAEQWVRDQRLPAGILSRVLLELSRRARFSDIPVAVSLARAALEADPQQWRVKHLALVLADVGVVNEALEVMRSAIATGVNFNPTELKRFDELSALARLEVNGLSLPKRSASRNGRTNSVILYWQKSFPGHWSASSLRGLSLASAFQKAGNEVKIVTVPGYPAIDKSGRVEFTKDIVAGIAHFRLPAIEVDSSILDTHSWDASELLAERIAAANAGAVVAPSSIELAYPAAIAARLNGARFILDCTTMTRAKSSPASEREEIIIALENALLAEADTVLVRDDFFTDRLAEAGVSADKVLPIGESVFQFNADKNSSDWSSSPILKGGFVIGYIGDAYDDMDLESFPAILDELVKRGLSVRLLIFGVGTRFHRVRDKLEALGHGDRCLFPGRPRNGHIAAAFAAIDLVVIPALPVTQRCGRSRFEIAEALAHGRPVLAAGSIASGMKPSLKTIKAFGEEMVAAMVDAVSTFILQPGSLEQLSQAAANASHDMTSAAVAERLVLAKRN